MEHSPDQTKQLAKAWYERQIAIIAKAHGSSWPLHKAWIEDYLKEELRERLLELGWRVKQ